MYAIIIIIKLLKLHLENYQNIFVLCFNSKHLLRRTLFAKKIKGIVKFSFDLKINYFFYIFMPSFDCC